MSGSESQCAELPEAPTFASSGFFRIFVSWESGRLTLVYITKQQDDKSNQSP